MINLEEVLENLEIGIVDFTRPKIVTICGSVRFMDEMLKWACAFTKRGYAVMMPHCKDHEHYHSTDGEEQKNGLDILHFQKILVSDIVFVVNLEGYIGSSTSNEIRAANALGKPVYYAEEDYREKTKDLSKILPDVMRSRV